MPGPTASPVAVVTDSTAYLPAATAAELGIAVVPLQVVLGGVAVEEGVGPGRASPAEVADALRAWVPVTTSRPSPEAFLTAWGAAAAAGAEAVVSVHLSGRLSGTVDAARSAAGSAPVPVEVVDSRSLGMGLGFAVLAAAGAARAGDSEAVVAAAARERAARTRAFFLVDTLEHLRRGGRIGAARALLGSTLRIKPLLALEDGGITPLEKVRTATRAAARLEEVALAAAVGVEGPVDLAVQHLGEPDRADALAERLLAQAPSGSSVVVGEVGAVLGAHVGPGLLGVVVAPR